MVATGTQFINYLSILLMQVGTSFIRLKLLLTTGTKEEIQQELLHMAACENFDMSLLQVVLINIHEQDVRMLLLV